MVCTDPVWGASGSIYGNYLCMPEQDREPECDLDTGSGPDRIFL